MQIIAKKEPKNSEILLSIVQPIARLAIGKNSILEQCRKMMQNAAVISPDSSDCHSELGYIYFLLGDYTASAKSLSTATSLDPHNIKALEGIIYLRSGMIRYQIFSNQIEAAEEQLTIFNELQRAMGPSAEISYLNSLLSWKKSQDAKTSLMYLNEAITIQLTLAKTLSLRYILINGSPSFYTKINVVFLLHVAEDFIEYCTVEKSQNGT